jgi:hypothetical protein
METQDDATALFFRLCLNEVSRGRGVNKRQPSAFLASLSEILRDRASHPERV